MPPDSFDDNWRACFQLWLDLAGSRSGSIRTRPEYARLVAQFFAWLSQRAPGLAPDQVTPTHAAQWQADLSRRLAPASVNKALAACSSFYEFASHHYAAGRVLWDDNNPFASPRLRARIQRYARARYPSTAQVRAILELMDTSSPLGLRDRALYGGLFVTTRRVGEWLPLRWEQITGNVFTVRIKGGYLLPQVMPDGLFAQIAAWLQSADHYPPAAGDYIFCAPGRWDRPLNAGYVNARLRHYGRLAGVPLPVCHCHGLRHAGARWLYEDEGATPSQLQRRLGHRSIATTEIYIRGVLAAPEDPQAHAVDAFLASLGGAASPLAPARIPSSRDSQPTGCLEDTTR